jgi:hypothetical protein
MLIFGSAILLSAQTSMLSSSPVIGDVNKDGSITIVDALRLAQYYVGITGIDAYLPFGDPNNDDAIDIIDALLVAKYYVGIITEFARKSPVDTVKAWAAANGVNLDGYIISLYGTKETATILPGYSFVVLIIRQYPVAYGPADPLLGTNAIAAVGKNNSVEIVNSTDKLVAFFKAHEIPATTEQKMLLTVKAWLYLSQELKDDGFYTFTIRDESVVILPVDSIQAEGISEVTGGGSGAIKANVWFSTPSYLVYQVVEKVELVAGIRPICQSTKLLDKDPIVRKMAEQDLLAMGVSCFEYLEAQRAKSSPELQKAIDMIWQRILEREVKLEKVRMILGK